jgi:AAA domain
MNDEGVPFGTTRYTAPSRFTLIRFADFKPLEGDDYCVKGFLPRTGLAVIWGPPKSGKSFFVFDLLMHVALGWDYRDHRVRPGPVVYVCLEGGRAFRKRSEAFRQAKLKGDENPPFFFVTNALSLAADCKALIGDIRRQVGEAVPAVVCVDTLNRSLKGSQSSDEDMAAYIKAADAIRDAFDCLVVIVHHCGHDGERPRGHSSLMGALDVQIAVRRDAESNVVVELELAKDGETGLVFVSRLEKFEIGRDEDDDPVTSCVVREVTDAAAKVAFKKPGKGRRSDDVEKVKRAIIEAYGRLADAAEKTPGFDGKPVKRIEIAKLRDEVKSRGYLDVNENGGLTTLGRKHFHRAKTDLIEAKRYIEAGGMFWRLDADGF